METFLVILILFFKDLKSIFLKERNENDTTNNNYFFKKYLFTDMIIYIHVSNSHIINLKIVSYFTKVKWGFSLIILSQHHLVYLEVGL